MLGFVQNWFSRGPFAAKANPIGVDFGSDSLRLAQVRVVDGEHRLIAAASADLPSHIRSDPQARLDFFVDTVRDLLSQGRFIGRQAILSLPVSQMYIQHLRLPRMDDEGLKKALPWELRGKIPIDPGAALLRHIVAGEIFADNDPKMEVIAMAAARDAVNQYLNAAAKARLDVVGMNVEPKALIDCFAHIFRRKTDAGMTNLFVDIGLNATRAIVARDGQVLFARVINVGGEHFNRAVAAAMNIGVADAKVLRLKLCAAQPATPQTRAVAPAPVAAPAEAPAAEPAAGDDDTSNSFALLGAALSAHQRAATPAAAPAERAPTLDRRVQNDPELDEDSSLVTPVQHEQARQVYEACREPLARLVEELDLCRRYYESTFPNKPVDRVLFVGGEARQRTLCQHIARELAMPAQVGDPMIRMAKTCEIGLESGIDRRQPQPGWAVAIGLSMGPTAAGEGRMATEGRTASAAAVEVKQ